MTSRSKKESKLSLFAVYAGGLKRWLSKNRWLKDNSVIIILSAIMLVCILALVLNHEYGSKLGEIGREISREVILAFLIANTVGLFYEFFARKSMAEELLRVVKAQLRKDDKLVDRLTTAILKYEQISESGLVDIGVSRGFFHEDVAENLKSAKQIRVLALHGTRLWVNKDLKTYVLNSAVGLRVLLVHPDSKQVATRASEFSDEYDNRAIRAQIVSAVRLLQKWKDKKNEACEIRLYDDVASFWLVFIDDLLYLSSYSRNQNSQDSEIYKIRDRKHSIFHMFDEHFERLWARSKDVGSIDEFRG